MTKRQDVLPCPFCGTMPEVFPKDPSTEGNAWAKVECRNSGCPTYTTFGRGVTVSDGETSCDDRGSDAYKGSAIARWNIRSASAANGSSDEQLRAALGSIIAMFDTKGAFIGGPEQLAVVKRARRAAASRRGKLTAEIEQAALRKAKARIISRARELLREARDFADRGMRATAGSRKKDEEAFRAAAELVMPRSDNPSSQNETKDETDG